MMRAFQWLTGFSEAEVWDWVYDTSMMLSAAMLGLAVFCGIQAL